MVQNQSTTMSSPGSVVTISDSNVVDQPFGYSGDLESTGFKPIVSYSCPLFRNQKERVGGRAFPFGVSNKRVENLVNKVCTDIYSGNVNFVQNQNVAQVSQRLLSHVDSVLLASGHQKCPRFLRQWLVAEAICAWILAEFGPDSVSYQGFDSWFASIQPENILRRANPYTACAGAAMLAKALTNELAKETGLSCDYVGGWVKDAGTSQVPELSNHSWNIFRFDGGIVLPADCTPTADSREWKKKWNVKQFAVRILPLNRECLEVFLTQKWGAIDYRNDNKDKFKLPLSNPTCAMSFADWKTLKIGSEFKNHLDWGNSHPFD